MEDDSDSNLDVAVAAAGSTVPIDEYGFDSSFDQRTMEMLDLWEKEWEMTHPPVVDLSREPPTSSTAAPASTTAGPGPVRASRRPRGPYQKNWLFTWNNFVDFDAPKAWPNVTYLAYQHEVAPTTGTHHLQGFVQFSKKMRVQALVKMAPIAWKAMTYGDEQDVDDYVCKEESRFPGSEVVKRGVMVRKGQRTDMSEVARAVISGKPLNLVCQENPDFAMRYSKGLQFLRRYATPPKAVREDLVVKLYIGPTGTGKTHAAVLEHPACYIKGTDKWFDNYIGQDVVVFDDFMGAASKIGLAELLRLLDKYRYQVEVKGGYEWLECTTLILTTNLHPRTWYKYEGREESFNALMRRFTEVHLFLQRGSPAVIIRPGTPNWEAFVRGDGFDLGRVQPE